MVPAAVEVLPLAAVAGVLVVAYASTAARTAASWPAWRTAVFSIGVVTVAAGLAPSWGDSFSAHVVGHLLVGMIGPLLVVLGDPVSLVIAHAQPLTRRRLLRWLHHPVVRRLSHPTVAWALAVLTPWVLWLTPLYDVTERNDVLHSLVHLHFILAGALFATVVLGVGPLGRRVPPAAGVLMLALTLPAHALLGLVLLSMAEPVVGLGTDAAAALDDQRRGAVILWLAGDMVATAMLAAVFPRWVATERRRARREDSWVAAREAAAAPAGGTRTTGGADGA